MGGGCKYAMTRLQQFRYVILPQATRIAIAPTVGFSVQIVKATAVTSIIGFTELTKTGSVLANATFEPFLVLDWLRSVISSCVIHCLPWQLILRRNFMALLHIHNLHKRFGDHHVLKGIGLEVEAGSVVSIIGRSGSGKSTLLRSINGLETIDEGYIEVDGTLLEVGQTDLTALRLKVGMIFQQFNLFPHLSVIQNVMLAVQIVKKSIRRRLVIWPC